MKKLDIAIAMCSAGYLGFMVGALTTELRHKKKDDAVQEKVKVLIDTLNARLEEEKLAQGA